MNPVELLRCTGCKSDALEVEAEGGYRCVHCNSFFPEEDGIVDFLNKEKEEVEEYREFFEKENPYELARAPHINFPIGHYAKMNILWTMLRPFEGSGGLTLLDAGCGDSPEAFKNLEKKGNTIVYLDISKEALRRVRRRDEDNRSFEKIFLASNETLPVADESLDIIFAGEIIEHVKSPEDYIADCARAVKPGGVMIFTTPNAKALTYRLLGRKYGVHPQHISLFGYASWERLLSEKLEILEARGFNQGIIGHRPDKVFNLSPGFCRFWANVFNDRPDRATGLIFKCGKP